VGLEVDGVVQDHVNIIHVSRLVRRDRYTSCSITVDEGRSYEVPNQHSTAEKLHEAFKPLSMPTPVKAGVNSMIPSNLDSKCTSTTELMASPVPVPVPENTKRALRNTEQGIYSARPKVIAFRVHDDK
jgi:hypothetical protein